jgi:type III secretion protein J
VKTNFALVRGRHWLWALPWLVACSAPIARDLDESEANRVVVALSDANIGATKKVDLQSEGRFVVEVPSAEASVALQVLQQRGLPSPQSVGILASLGEGGLVASRTAEHARLVVGIAGELERSLRDIDGVLSARVHLAVPDAASVLLRHRGATPPIAASEVQRLVAGAVAGLHWEQVAVVTQPVTIAETDASRSVVQLGPISVSQSSVTPLKALLGVVGLLNILLVGFVLVVWQRAKTGRAAHVDAT